MTQFRGARLSGSVGQRVILAASLWVAASLALAVATFWWQATQVGGLESFRWPLLVPAMAFAAVSFGLRTLRWHSLLAAAGARPPLLTSLRTQLIGFSLTMTPGKVGEIYKCYLIERRTGVPTARTAPIVLFEKLMDALAFGGLALLAAALLPDLADAVNTGARTLIGAGVAFVAIAVLVQMLRPHVVFGLLMRWLGRVPFGRRIASAGALVLAGSIDLLHAPTLAKALALGIIARSCDGLALTWAAYALGINIAPIAGIFVLNSSGAIGGLSMLPGGIGVVEASMSVLLASLGAAPAAALAATLMARLLTFWIWVAVGLYLLVTSEELRLGGAQEDTR
jgi:uncharacterized membrane protein YbhN (UPF0104 family)